MTTKSEISYQTVDTSKYDGLTLNISEQQLNITNSLKGDVPFGGTACGVGIQVKFQEGIPSKVGHNGCYIEDLLIVAKERLKFCQDNKFTCQENAIAIDAINAAIASLVSRTQNRTTRGVKDTHNK